MWKDSQNLRFARRERGREEPTNFRGRACPSSQPVHTILTVLMTLALCLISSSTQVTAQEQPQFSTPIQYPGYDGNPAQSGPGGVTLVDVEGDLDLDMVVAFYDQGVVRVMKNDGSGLFFQSEDYGVAYGCLGVSAADLNGDSRFDLIVGMLPTECDSFFVLLNDQNGGFLPALSVKAHFGPVQVSPIDLDADGDIDLVVSDKISDCVDVFDNDGNANFTLMQTIPGTNWVHGTTAGDWNHDGDIDLALTDLIPSCVQIWYWDGVSSQFYQKQVIPISEGYASELTTGDWNHDGWLDMAVTGHGDVGSVTIFQNLKDSTFLPVDTISPVPRCWEIEANDFNGDGHPDLVTGKLIGNDSLTVFLGDGSGGFGAALTYQSGTDPQWLDSGDLDADGDQDIIVRNGALLDSISVIFNLTSQSNDTLRIGNPNCLSSLLPSQQVVPIYLDNKDTVKAFDFPISYPWSLDPTSISFVGTRMDGKTGLFWNIEPDSSRLRIVWADLTGNPANWLPPATEATKDIPIAKIVVPVTYGCIDDSLAPPDTTSIWVGIDLQSLLITDQFANGQVPVVVAESTLVTHYRVGDVDFNQLVNISDVVYLINYIFGSGPVPSCFNSADVDMNTLITISDAVYLINYIFAGGVTPGSGKLCGYQPPVFKSGPGMSQIEFIDNHGLSVWANSDLQALQLQFAAKGAVVDISVTCSDPRFQVFSGWVDGEYRVGVIDLTGKTTLPAGTHDLLRIGYSGDGELVLNNAIVVDGDAQEMNVTINRSTGNATLPTEFALYQNQPNPFNPTTDISFSLPKASDVRLVIYNLLGQEVTTLVNEFMAAGVHRATWNSRDQAGRAVASGVYMYRLEAGEYSQTKKMMLLK